ncbi:MAG: DNA methyltransferase, partial [Microcystis panniformis]
VWKINPVTNSKHPAAFPVELAEKVITYYSFKGDVVLDPFAGSGTVGLAATSLDRRFVLFESNFNYIELMQQTIPRWKNIKFSSILWLNCKPSKLPPEQIEIQWEAIDDNNR